ncbi:MAG: hypothetical protein QOG91_4 [Candidatus Parcubacteria bacterium]|nr:hypothetical protein [Candidatus Parcubacteria bacterium]
MSGKVITQAGKKPRRSSSSKTSIEKRELPKNANFMGCGRDFFSVIYLLLASLQILDLRFAHFPGFFGAVGKEDAVQMIDLVLKNLGQ